MKSREENVCINSLTLKVGWNITATDEAQMIRHN